MERSIFNLKGFVFCFSYFVFTQISSEIICACFCEYVFLGQLVGVVTSISGVLWGLPSFIINVKTRTRISKLFVFSNIVMVKVIMYDNHHNVPYFLID